MYPAKSSSIVRARRGKPCDMEKDKDNCLLDKCCQPGIYIPHNHLLSDTGIKHNYYTITLLQTLIIAFYYNRRLHRGNKNGMH